MAVAGITRSPESDAQSRGGTAQNAGTEARHIASSAFHTSLVGMLGNASEAVDVPGLAWRLAQESPAEQQARAIDRNKDRIEGLRSEVPGTEVSSLAAQNQDAPETLSDRAAKRTGDPSSAGRGGNPASAGQQESSDSADAARREFQAASHDQRGSGSVIKSHEPGPPGVSSSQTQTEASGRAGDSVGSAPAHHSTPAIGGHAELAEGRIRTTSAGQSHLGATDRGALAAAVASSASGSNGGGGGGDQGTGAHGGLGAEGRALARGALAASLSSTTPQRAHSPFVLEAEPAKAQIGRGLAQLLTSNGGSVTMKLTPERLGEVRAHIQIHDRVASVRLEASTSEARALLEHEVGSLRAALESRGIELGSVKIEGPHGYSDDAITRDETSTEEESERGADDQPAGSQEDRLGSARKTTRGQSIASDQSIGSLGDGLRAGERYLRMNAGVDCDGASVRLDAMA